jgi:hypothetical protein
VGAVKGETDPPPVLSLWWKCNELNTPPEAGGILDQDEKLMNTMRSLDSVYNAMYRYQNLKGEHIHRLTDNERRTIRMLIDLGVFY